MTYAEAHMKPKTLEKFKRVISLRLTKRLGIDNACIQTFRHTFASHLIMNGVDLVTGKELLAHRDITTTMRYAHLVPGHKRWTVNRICSVFSIGTIWAQSEKFVK